MPDLAELADREEVERLWREGVPITEMARRLGWTTPRPDHVIRMLRRAGCDLPPRGRFTHCQRCGAELPGLHPRGGKPRKFCSAECGQVQTHDTCSRCGGQKSRRARICQHCRGRELGRERWAQFAESRARMVRLWKGGATLRELEAAMGWAPGSAGARITYYRTAGVDLPYRRSATQRERIREGSRLGKERAARERSVLRAARRVVDKQRAWLVFLSSWEGSEDEAGEMFEHWWRTRELRHPGGGVTLVVDAEEVAAIPDEYLDGVPIISVGWLSPTPEANLPVGV